jgi:hypothetical protein
MTAKTARSIGTPYRDPLGGEYIRTGWLDVRALADSVTGVLSVDEAVRSLKVSPPLSGLAAPAPWGA